MNNVILWIAMGLTIFSMGLLLTMLGMLIYIASKEDKKDNKKRGKK